jgi:hypothetical protein
MRNHTHLIGVKGGKASVRMSARMLGKLNMARINRPNTMRLQRITKGFWESAALMSAVELELFTAIDKGANTIAKIAAALDIETVNAERLMVALAAMELLVRQGDTFTNADDVDRFLVKDKPTYAGPWMLFGKPRWDGWGKLTEHLRIRQDEQKLLGMYDSTFTEARAREYHAATYSIGMGAARLFHRQVDLSGRNKIMDLGGGSGCYCIVAVQNHPHIKGEVLDLAPVVGVTRDYLKDNQVEDNVIATACDFTQDPLPVDADVAIMASNLPQYNRAIIAGIVSRVYAALLPGGEFHLLGEMVNAAGSGPLAPALWGLSEAVSRSTGLAHSTADCEGYFADAGFINVTTTEFIPETLTRITGYKPA